MTWLVAVALRPFGALLFFGSAAVIAYLLRPLIPQSWRAVLYDRTIKKRHPRKFAFFGMAACYGMLALVYWLI